MKGHFCKRGDKWYFWAELGTDGDGKRQQVLRGGFRTRREAEAAFAAMRDELRKGTFVSESKTTVREFLIDEWLPAIRVSIRPSTLDNYSSAMKRYVVPGSAASNSAGSRRRCSMLCTQIFSRQVVRVA